MSNHIENQIIIAIDRLSSKGFGVSSWKKEGSPVARPVRVPGTLPGDRVLVAIPSVRKREYTGKLLEVLSPSELRTEPRCCHVPSCGGCSLQPMLYQEQVKYKEDLILKLFSPLMPQEILPLVSAENTWGYRNKMEFTFSQDKEGNRFLGLIRAGSKGRVEHLKECFLCPDWFVEVLKKVFVWWETSSLQAFHLIKGTGTLRTLTLREAKNTGQKMAFLTVSGNPAFACSRQHLDQFKKAVTEIVGESISLFLRVQQAIPGQETQFYEMHLGGPEYIVEKMTIAIKGTSKELSFAVSPTAFFQPNTTQAEKLYSRAVELVGLSPKQRVLDLYAGTATLGILFSFVSKMVLSIEINPYAVFDAERNKELNGVSNIVIKKGDVAKVLRQVIEEDPSWKSPDLILVDPPRSGLSPDALLQLLSLGAQEILYISCFPQTLARDCQLLQEGGYELITVQSVDQFPHTIHIETIVHLKKR